MSESNDLALNKFYESVLDMMPVGLGVRKNIESRPEIEFENRRIKELFADTGLEDCPYSWQNDLEAADATISMRFKSNGIFAIEKTFPSGRIYQFTTSYYRDDNFSWREINIVTDVTRQRQLESELREAKENLEHKVEERTRELKDKQTQLAQAEKMASLGNLVAGVAHEINTPMGALKSNNDLFIRYFKKLREKLNEDVSPRKIFDDEGLLKLFENIQNLNRVNQTAADRIVNIIASLRKFARLDKADKDRYDVHEGLESTLTLVHHELKNRIEVIKEYGQIPEIFCYPNQINQVFMNILVNASQAIADKGVITIKTYPQDANVVIEIADTGCGIGEETRKHIFDPGFTTKGSGVGTGLGLSIVHQIIEDHKGEIEVASEVGKGTTFKIILPVSRKK